MALQSNTNVAWDCSNCTYENQLENALCEICGAKKNALSPTMIKLQNEMSQLLNLVEIEKRKIPPNINTIQSYINLHSHKMHKFQNQILFTQFTNERLYDIHKKRCEKQLTLTALEWRQTTLKNAKNEQERREKERKCNSGLLNKLNLVQMINLLILGYLKSVGLKNSIIDINCLIQRYYASHVDTNPDNFIGKMMINCNYLNDAVEMFSSQRHAVIVRSRPNPEMVYFSLQSQTKHAIKCGGHQWKLCNGNLISLGRNNSEGYHPRIYNIASNTIYPIPHFLNSDREYIGCCASAKRGIFAIGGNFQRAHKYGDSTNGVYNIKWNRNVTQLASYWRRTWASTPLFIDNDNKVINIGGGYQGRGSQIVGLYSFQTNKWQRLADIPYRSKNSGACYNKFDETVYVTGGYQHSCRTKLKLCVRYSTHSNQWEKIAQTNWYYYDISPCVSVINNSFVLLTSEGDNGLKMEYLDIRTNCKRFTVLVGTDDKKGRNCRNSIYDLITNNF